MSNMTVTVSEPLERAAASGLQHLVETRFASRLAAADASLWGQAAATEAEIRLGWVDPFAGAEAALSTAERLRETHRERGFDRVVLCGMGGSSLGPEVIARWAGVPLTLLDTTHPAAIERVLRSDLQRTSIVVSSKSGGTVETMSQLAALEAAFADLGAAAADHVAVVTDPASPLEARARERGYACVPADPNVGGRFSALTAFGLVPTVLAGADGTALLRDARGAASALSADSPENPALRIAAAIAAGLPARYVMRIDEHAASPCGLGDWLEQLVAESTGKSGLGVLPIAQGAFPLVEPSPQVMRLAIGPSATLTPATDLAVAAPLGAQFLLWETATAALGHLMGINPFDQPDVEASKRAAREALTAQSVDRGHEAEPDPSEVVRAIRAGVTNGSYLAVQAFVDPTEHNRARLLTLCGRLAADLGVPVALGFGPRYLHSTGQLHKGGPATASFLQIHEPTPEHAVDSPTTTDFAALISAQARGDYAVLRGLGRPVHRIHLGALDAVLAELA